jgi:Carbohydrate esterase, sialic acid-specific acetylesterase
MLKFNRHICFLLLQIAIQSALFAQNNRNRIFPQVEEYPLQQPVKNKVWVFIMAGQSNMAGRAIVEPADTLSNKRILTINAKGTVIVAKEPLHFYEPAIAGLDCGVAFARFLLQHIPDSISVLLIPAAVGGSSITQWLGDSLHRGVQLLTNLKSKVQLAKQYGTVKAILWHQGESDAKAGKVKFYQKKLSKLHSLFRTLTNNKALPIITGGIGLFANDTIYQQMINKYIYDNAAASKYTFTISTNDFLDIGDKLHFNSVSQRLMGERMAQQFINLINKKK